MTEKVKIVIVDDHKIFRVGLQAILETFDDIQVTGDVSTGRELFDLLSREEVDVIFMDIDLISETGIELTRQVMAKYPEMRVIAITSSDEVGYFNDMLEAGAAAFILKQATEEELDKAIREVLNGQYYFSKEYMFLAKKYIAGQRKQTHMQFSERELEVLGLICRGYSNQEIADSIGISVHTVDSHRRNLLTKTGAKNTARLVMSALKEGWIDLE